MWRSPIINPDSFDCATAGTSSTQNMSLWPGSTTNPSFGRFAQHTSSCIEEMMHLNAVSIFKSLLMCPFNLPFVL